MAIEDLLDLETELKPFLRILDTPSKDDVELGLLNTRVAFLIEEETRRRFVFRGAPNYVEFHSMLEFKHSLWTRDKPVTQLVKITEDANADHTNAPALVKNDDFTIDPRTGEIMRIGGNLPLHWEIGVRSVRVEYQAGFTDKASLPPNLKLGALKLASNLWNKEKEGLEGVRGKEDSTGSKTFFEQRSLSPDIMRLLLPFKQVGDKTWEEDLP